MKALKLLTIITAVMLFLTGCVATQIEELPKYVEPEEETTIILSDDEIKVEGVGKDFVSVANDIIYYEEGKDFTYGEGDENDAHSQEEASEHKVVHISKAGRYVVSGSLSKGQIAVDLGEDAKDDPSAVVTLVLDGVDITSTVAPAVIFYNVYECGEKNVEKATKNVSTSNAGARVRIAEGSVNNVNGSYVAKIYKPDSVELNESKTKVLDAKKLHKYDGAFYSKRSMVISGSGTLNINAENEGLDSELHLTINGGNINIKSGNDGINTNEDNVSVTTVNGGILTIEVTGETGEGDGIDSNGWLVINGGTVVASACSFSADAGIDSDRGIHINGGTVIASGSMLDRIEEGGQTYAVFNFDGKQKGGHTITLKNEMGDSIISQEIKNDYSVLVISGSKLTQGTYTLWKDDVQLQGVKTEGMSGMRPGGMGGFGGGQRPEGMPEGFNPDNMQRPEGFDPNNIPEGFNPDNMQMPEGFNRGEAPRKDRDFNKGDNRDFNSEEFKNLDGGFSGKPMGNSNASGELSTNFVITQGANHFSNVTILEAIPE